MACTKNHVTLARSAAKYDAASGEFPLEHCPPEIRRIIYKHAIDVGPNVIGFKGATKYRNPMALSLVNKQISADAIDVFYLKKVKAITLTTEIADPQDTVDKLKAVLNRAKSNTSIKILIRSSGGHLENTIMESISRNRTQLRVHGRYFGIVGHEAVSHDQALYHTLFKLPILQAWRAVADVFEEMYSTKRLDLPMAKFVVDDIGRDSANAGSTRPHLQEVWQPALDAVHSATGQELEFYKENSKGEQTLLIASDFEEPRERLWEHLDHDRIFKFHRIMHVLEKTSHLPMVGDSSYLDTLGQYTTDRPDDLVPAQLSRYLTPLGNGQRGYNVYINSNQDVPTLMQWLRQSPLRLRSDVTVVLEFIPVEEREDVYAVTSRYGLMLSTLRYYNGCSRKNIIEVIVGGPSVRRWMVVAAAVTDAFREDCTCGEGMKLVLDASGMEDPSKILDLRGYLDSLFNELKGWVNHDGFRRRIHTVGTTWSTGTA